MKRCGMLAYRSLGIKVIGDLTFGKANGWVKPINTLPLIK